MALYAIYAKDPLEKIGDAAIVPTDGLLNELI
jgi:hypothetical protein